MVSNPDISYALKLSLPTATQITKELVERGLVEETGEMESTGGRRAKALAVSGSVGKACYCGKYGCLDAYCSAKCLTDGKVEDFFGKPRQGEKEAVGL